MASLIKDQLVGISNRIIDLKGKTISSMPILPSADDKRLRVEDFENTRTAVGYLASQSFYPSIDGGGERQRFRWVGSFITNKITIADNETSGDIDEWYPRRGIVIPYYDVPSEDDSLNKDVFDAFVSNYNNQLDKFTKIVLPFYKDYDDTSYKKTYTLTSGSYDTFSQYRTDEKQPEPSTGSHQWTNLMENASFQDGETSYNAKFPQLTLNHSTRASKNYKSLSWECWSSSSTTLYQRQNTDRLLFARQFQCAYTNNDTYNTTRHYGWYVQDGVKSSSDKIGYNSKWTFDAVTKSDLESIIAACGFTIPSLTDDVRCKIDVVLSWNSNVLQMTTPTQWV